jgi:fibronectin type 3 domain-containing protein
MTPRGHHAALIVLATLAIIGCGRKGLPVAPELREPLAVTSFEAMATAEGIELSWSNPARRVDNTRLRDLTVARVFRSEDSGAGEPRPALRTGNRIAGYTEIATIRLVAPAPAVVQGARVVLADSQGLVDGRRYTYVVLAEDSQGRASAPSTRRPVTYITAPTAPSGVTAEAGDGEVRLRWAPPTRLVDGAELSGELSYEVLRAPEGEAGLQTITTTPITERDLIDRNVVNERPYHYVVRAVRSEAGATARGAPSERVAVTPLDMTPPSPPGRLVVVPSAGTARLSWGASPEPDVAAYVVYRAHDQGDFVRIGATRAPATTFVDRDVAPGTYRYAVTAQDGGARANESARSDEVRVTVP